MTDLNCRVNRIETEVNQLKVFASNVKLAFRGIGGSDTPFTGPTNQPKGGPLRRPATPPPLPSTPPLPLSLPPTPPNPSAPLTPIDSLTPLSTPFQSTNININVTNNNTPPPTPTNTPPPTPSPSVENLPTLVTTITPTNPPEPPPTIFPVDYIPAVCSTKNLPQSLSPLTPLLPLAESAVSLLIKWFSDRISKKSFWTRSITNFPDVTNLLNNRQSIGISKYGKSIDADNPKNGFKVSAEKMSDALIWLYKQKLTREKKEKAFPLTDEELKQIGVLKDLYKSIGSLLNEIN